MLINIKFGLIFQKNRLIIVEHLLHSLQQQCKEVPRGHSHHHVHVRVRSRGDLLQIIIYLWFHDGF